MIFSPPVYFSSSSTVPIDSNKNLDLIGRTQKDLNIPLVNKHANAVFVYNNFLLKS